MSALPARSSIPSDTILTTLPRAVWFSAVGEPLTHSELDEVRGYLRGIRHPDAEIHCADGWGDAKAITVATNWRRDWWQTEHSEEQRLLALASQRFGTDAVMQRLTSIMEGGADLFLGPAAVASARAGVADSALARSAAGAASQSLHQFGLAMLVGESSEHFFAIKFRLFLAGRWPLSLNDNTFNIF